MLRSFAIAAFRHGEATASRRFALDWERAITNSTATCSHAGWANQGRSFCRATEDDGWWNGLTTEQIAEKVEEMAKAQRSPSIKAQLAMFTQCESVEAYDQAIAARKRAFKLGMHLCKGQQKLLSGQEAHEAAQRLKAPHAMLGYLLNLSALGFEARQEVVESALADMAKTDAVACVPHIPAMLRVMAAHGFQLTPATCDVCCTICINAQQPAAAAAVLAAFSAEAVSPSDESRARVAAAADAAVASGGADAVVA